MRSAALKPLAAALLLLTSSLWTSSAAAVEQGVLDASFAMTVVNPNVAPPNNSEPCAPIFHPSGRMVALVREFSASGDPTISLVGRLNNGAVDPAFGPTGKRVVEPAGCGGLAMRPDGELWFASNLGLTRLLADGTPNAQIPASALPAATSPMIDLLPDGRVIVAQQTQNGGDILVSAFFADGSPDVAFGNGGTITLAFDLGGSNIDVLRDVEVTPNGRIFIGATVPRSATDTDFGVYALTPSGQVDVSWNSPVNVIDVAGRRVVPFDLGGTMADRLYALSVAEDGRLAMVGSSESTQVAGDSVTVVVLAPDGKPDVNFDGDGRRAFKFASIAGSDAYGYSSAFDLAGNLVIVGMQYSAFQSKTGVARLLADGSHDPIFAGGAPILERLGPLNTEEDGQVVGLQYDANPRLFGRFFLSTPNGAGYEPFVAGVTGQVVHRSSFED